MRTRIIRAGAALAPSEDRLADAQRQLERCLPPQAGCVVPGTHDWPGWRQLWENLLDLHGGPADGTWT